MTTEDQAERSAHEEGGGNDFGRGARVTTKPETIAQVLRIPVDLKAELKKQSALNGRSLNAEMVTRLARSLQGGRRTPRVEDSASAEYLALSDAQRAILRVFDRLGPEKQLALISLFK